jgi:hypothetical protein
VKKGVLEAIRFGNRGHYLFDADKLPDLGARASS